MKQTSTKQLVAIVGRPNVGKSTLFNRIVGWQKAIVEDIPGVTRDRIYGETEWDGVEFRIVDTGGYDEQSDDLYPSLIRSQIEKAVEEADLILFLLDGKTGVMPQDIEVSNYLRKTDKRVLHVVNKTDHGNHEIRALDFHVLGVKNLITVSSTLGRKIDELLDAVIENLPKMDYSIQHSDRHDEIRVTVVGKPNVGKSTLINRILGEDRMLTSPVPGTTRDAIDTLIEWNGKRYVFIDTAGIRRKAKIIFSVERYSVQRAVKTIERADIVLLMIDAEEGPSHQDGHLSQLIREKGKACIILLNKWDLVPKELAEKQGIQDIVTEKLQEIDFSPVILVSALKGKNVVKIFDYINSAYENYSRRIPTRQLNDFLDYVLETNPPPLYKAKEIKFYYISQPMTKPPTFVIFTNSTKGIPEGYRRFLENRLREQFELEGTPIKFIFRGRKKK